MIVFMRNQTARNGSKTSSKTSTRHSALTIIGKDPNFDYCFRTKHDIEQGGGEDSYGWQAIGEDNYAGEKSGGPLAQFHKTKSSKQIVYMDTIACKRPKEVSRYFQSEDDEKYNSQVNFVKSVGRNTQQKLREALSADGFKSDVEDNSQYAGRSMTQRKGTTEEYNKRSE